VPSLEALQAAGHEIALVVTQPDRPGHRLKVTPSPVKVAAQRLRLEVFQPERIREPAAVERLAAMGSELIVVVAYGQIIPSSILEMPPRGVVNVHASLLPRHRGAAPIAYTILAGDRVTGVTIMQMDEQLDHGPVLAVCETEVGPREDAPSLTRRLAALGADCLVDTLGRLDEIVPREQDHAAATLAPRLKKEAGELGWSLPAEEIDRRVRAFKPWPGVMLPWRGERLKVLAGRPVPGPAGEPGDYLGVQEGGILVATGSGAYLLEEVQLPGKRPMPARILVAAGA